MADDKLVPFLDGLIRMKDMGDGTYAPVVFIAGGAEGGAEVTAIGSPTDPAWNGSDASASLISIMKACYGQLVQINENTGM
jgi:hypothetical protein